MKVFTCAKGKDMVAAYEQAKGSGIVFCDDVYAASAAALAEARKQRAVAVIARDSDLIAPEGSPHSATEWRLAWESCMASKKVATITLMDGNAEQKGLSTQESAIRSYLGAVKQLKGVIRKTQIVIRQRKIVSEGGFIPGKPPYGYRVKDGVFMKGDPARVAAIQLIFRMRDQEDAGLNKIIAATKKLIPTEFWDSTKLMRILKRRDLYGRGVYVPAVGDPITNAAFIIL